MGWLRDLIEQSDSGHRSFGDLARAALKHGDWPAKSQMGERSLASILSKLDRNQEADWLAERAGVQRVLSKVLGVPLDDVRSPASNRGRPLRGDTRRLRLTSLHYARALDLLDEPLCPGLPEAVLVPAAYQSLFWRAPSGSGRSLVGHFLEARGLACVIEAATFEEALTRLPERGPVFIELHAQRALPLGSAPRAGLCVAGDFEPGDGNWQKIYSPPVESYLGELVDWVTDRLPADGRFDAQRTLQWLKNEILDSGVLDGLGAALGLCGLADEMGVPSLQRKSVHQLAERFCRERLLSTLDGEALHATWLKRHGYQALVGLGRRVLADSDAAWDEPRPLATWLELVPLEHQREPDLDWMRSSLSQADSNIRPSDIERAARKIPPGAFRIVRAVQQAELLRASQRDTGNAPPSEIPLSLGPRWFSNALRSAATRSLVSGDAHGFGAALLREHAAPDIARELVRRLSDRGSAFIDGLLELEGGDSPAHVAAVDMTFRAAGVALLSGAEIATDSLEALWDEVIEARLEFPRGLPCPRIEYPTPERDALLSRGLWYLSAFAVSGELGQRAGRRHALLRPWKTREVHPDLRAVCAQIARDLPKNSRDRSWVLRAFSLISRLRAEVGALGDMEAPEVLERPAVILDEVAHGVLSWSTVAGIADDELGLPALHALAVERGLPFAAVASAVWQAWSDAQRPSDGARFLTPSSAVSHWFWPHIPSELLHALLADEQLTTLPYEAFGGAQWQVFLAARGTAGARVDEARAFALAPTDVLEQALLSGDESRALCANLWQRLPERATQELLHALGSPEAGGVARLRELLRTAPAAQSARVFEALSRPDVVNVGQEKLTLVRHFLQQHIRERRPGYLEAYERLSGLERQLTSAHR